MSWSAFECEDNGLCCVTSQRQSQGERNTTCFQDCLRFISCSYLHLQRRILIECPCLGFTVFKEAVLVVTNICASCSAFRHGLYHPYELLEQVKAHWLQVVFSSMSYIFVLLCPIWSWWESLVQWKCVLAHWQCPSRLAVSHVIIKYLLLLHLCWQTITCLQPHPTVCREICHTEVYTHAVGWHDILFFENCSIRFRKILSTVPNIQNL